MGAMAIQISGRQEFTYELGFVYYVGVPACTNDLPVAALGAEGLACLANPLPFCRRGAIAVIIKAR